jgi:hypothetical protein
MRKFLNLSILLLTTFALPGQTPVGSWSDHLVYNTAQCVAVGTDEVFASTGSSLIIYNKSFAELRKMSRINGLTETGISTIGWSEENKTLIIVYTSTNVDLLKNNIIYNIPDIARKYIPGNKVINRVRTNGNRYMIHGNQEQDQKQMKFGISLLEVVKYMQLPTGVFTRVILQHQGYLTLATGNC